MKYAKFLTIVLVLILLMPITACKKEPILSFADDCSFKVGVIYPGDAGDDIHEAGILTMAEQLGLSTKQIIRKIRVDDTDKAKAEAAISEAIDEGAQIIYGTSYGYTAIMEKMAGRYPHIIFSQVGEQKSALPNLNFYAGHFYEAEYLSGIAAGLKTKTNKIGYLAAADKESGSAENDIHGFAQGVKAVNPYALVYLRVTGAFPLNDGVKEASAELLDMGCDVLGHNFDTDIPRAAAEGRSAWSCGYNTASGSEASPTHLVAPVINWGVYYTRATRDVMEGKWSGKNYTGGLSDGLISLPSPSAHLEEGTKAAIETAQTRIASGEFKVLDGGGTSEEAVGGRYPENIVE